MIAASPQGFAAHFNVSRETIARLEALSAIALKWNKRINLIGRDTEATLWQRHMADSAQLWALRPTMAGSWVDLGSGAGFPALVLAAFAADIAPAWRFTLVESDVRKAAFLAEASRAMDLAPTILDRRIETLAPLCADVLSARALAPLDRLLAHAEKHLAPHGIGLFPKGETVHKEIAAAAAKWRFDRRIHLSVTEPGAAIVEVGAVSSV
jgi:16S rRNA (guanine527-N7)-methyltransferase